MDILCFYIGRFTNGHLIARHSLCYDLTRYAHSIFCINILASQQIDRVRPCVYGAAIHIDHTACQQNILAINTATATDGNLIVGHIAAEAGGNYTIFNAVASQHTHFLLIPIANGCPAAYNNILPGQGQAASRYFGTTDCHRTI